MDKFITEKGINVLKLVNKYKLNNYYDKMSGQIIIDRNKITNEMMSILNNYAKELEEICNETIYNGEWEDFYIVGEISE